MSGSTWGKSLWVLALVSTAAFRLGAQEPADRPCSAPEYRQFDFWVGDWSVTDPHGEHEGDNRIEKILDGCVLMESWNGAGGTRGHSLNIYSARSGKWHQTWVDSKGSLLQLDGGIEDGKMVMSGTTIGRDGGPVNHVISWEPLDDGTVRQTWRASRDGGKTWKELFVGIYSRK